MNQKTLWSWVVVLAVAAGAVYFFAAYDRSESGQIKIGVIASLTGTGASRGESVQDGLSLAREKLAARGTLRGREVALVFADVPLNQAKLAPAALQKLVDIDKVSAVIGPMGSTVVMSVVPFADEKAVPLIVHAASTLAATDGNEYVFRLWPTAHNYAAAITQGITARGYARVAALSATHENTIDLLKILEEGLPRVGAPFVISEQVSPETKDFRTQLAKMKAAQPDAVFLNLFEGQIGVAADQARTLGITAPFFTNAVMSAVELSGNPRALEGAWFPRFGGYTDAAKQEFAARFGKEPAHPDSAAAAHDALLALGEAIGRVGGDSMKIQEYLYANSFTGAMGPFRFMPSGDAEIAVQLFSVQGGEIAQIR